MTSAEVTPGALGRMTLHDNPGRVADELARWALAAEDQLAMAAWFHQLAALLELEAASAQ